MNLLKWVVMVVTIAGCSPTNVSQLVKSLAADKNGNCVQVSTMWGTVVTARGSSDASVEVSGNSCKIIGNGVGSINVPVKVQGGQ